jgi:hypothetical protein
MKNKIYILTSDGHRDSANLQKYAYDDDSMIRLLKEEVCDMGWTILEDTVDIDYSRCIISYRGYQYGDASDVVTCAYRFITIKAA